MGAYSMGLQFGSSAAVTGESIADPPVMGPSPGTAPSPSEVPLTIVWQVDPGALLETDWINDLITRAAIRAGRPVETVIDLAHRWIGPGAIVVTRGDPSDGVSMCDYLGRFRAQGLGVGVFHVGDEFSASPVDFYAQAEFVLRQCYRPGVMDLPNVRFVPLGAKRGFHEHVVDIPILQRSRVWSFAGCVRGRLSRRAMAWHARRIPAGVISESSVFNDSSALGFPDYVRLLCDTQFCLAPGGNRVVESYRVYEAMDAGAIPIVEVLTVRKLLWTVARDLLSAKRRKTFGTFSARYWKEMAWWMGHRNFWTHVFGAAFPCPQVKSWRKLRGVIARADPLTLSAAVQAFWIDYQADLVATIATLATLHLPA